MSNNPAAISSAPDVDRRFFKSGWVNVVGWTAWVLMFVLPPRIDGPWGMAVVVICSVTATACFLQVLKNRRRADRSA